MIENYSRITPSDTRELAIYVCVCVCVCVCGAFQRRQIIY